MATVDSSYYVYMLCDQENGEPRYVGRGKKDRWRRHFKAGAKHAARRASVAKTQEPTWPL